jgi:RNA polymerase sigma-70 factor (ECF subfamily)
MAFEFLKRKLVARDPQTLEELFNLFNESVYKSAYYITRDRMLAEDVVQDTFLKAYDKIDQLKDASRVEFWLIRIAMNKARDLLRRRQRQVTTSGNDYLSPDTPDDLPEAQLLAREEHLLINAAIDRLKPEYQDVIFLKYYRDFTTKAIAETLQIHEGTVKTRLRKARALIESALREAMDTREEEGEPRAQRMGR